MISPKKQAALAQWMTELGIKESDLSEQFIKGSGKGGQKTNKSTSAVQLKHLPSGIIIKCHKDRSREANRFFARRQLCEALDKKVNANNSKLNEKINKIRKQKHRRKRRNLKET